MYMDVVERLAQHRKLVTCDARTGRFILEDDGRSIEVSLPPSLLPEYAASLGYPLDAAAATSSEERQHQLQVQHLVILIEEFIDSDLDLSLIGLSLTRSADGHVYLADRRGAPRAPNTPTVKIGGYWTSEPGSA